MKNKPNDFKVGLFILFGVAILLAGLFIFGASKWFEGKTLEETYVEKSVEGLKVGAPVLLHGVPVGEVTKINFSWNLYHVTQPRYVVVEFEVGNQVSLVPPGKGYEERVKQEVAKGLRAQIKSQGLRSAPKVTVTRTQGREWSRCAKSPVTRLAYRKQGPISPDASWLGHPQMG